MNFIKEILQFFKRIFNKEKQPLLLNGHNDVKKDDTRTEFIENLKTGVNTSTPKTAKVETLICVGDGLGIQNKISF